jgi:hypothetical protein
MYAKGEASSYFEPVNLNSTQFSTRILGIDGCRRDVDIVAPFGHSLRNIPNDLGNAIKGRCIGVCRLQDSH